MEIKLINGIFACNKKRTFVIMASLVTSMAAALIGVHLAVLWLPWGPSDVGTIYTSVILVYNQVLPNELLVQCIVINSLTPPLSHTSHTAPSTHIHTHTHTSPTPHTHTHTHTSPTPHTPSPSHTHTYSHTHRIKGLVANH